MLHSCRDAQIRRFYSTCCHPRNFINFNKKYKNEISGDLSKDCFSPTERDDLVLCRLSQNTLPFLLKRTDQAEPRFPIEPRMTQR